MARHLGRGAAIRKRVNRRAPNARQPEGVRVDGDEQVRPLLAGDLGAPAQRHVVIAGAHQHGFEAIHGTEFPLHPLGDGQHDVLLVGAGGGDGPGVVAAMPGIHRDEHIPFLSRLRSDAWLAWRFRRIEVHHQAMAVWLDGLQREVFGPRRLCHVQHHAMGAAKPPPQANPQDGIALRLGGLETALRARLLQIDDHAVRVLQREHLVAHRCVGVEHDAGVIRRLVGADAFEVHTEGRRCPSQQGGHDERFRHGGCHAPRPAQQTTAAPRE